MFAVSAIWKAKPADRQIPITKWAENLPFHLKAGARRCKPARGRLISPKEQALVGENMCKDKNKSLHKNPMIVMILETLSYLCTNLIIFYSSKFVNQALYLILQ